MEQLSPEELISYGKKAIDTAMRKGADEAEAFLTKSLKTSVAVERGQITKNMRKRGQGLAVRAIFQKGVGFSYTNMLNEESVMKTATEAYRSAKASRPDKEWPGFPSSKKYGSPKEKSQCQYYVIGLYQFSVKIITGNNNAFICYFIHTGASYHIDFIISYHVQ